MINGLSKAAVYKINVQNQLLSYIAIKNLPRNKSKKQIPFTIASKKEHLGVSK